MQNSSQNICLIAEKHPKHSASIAWVAAALFSKYLPQLSLNIQLLEIDDPQYPEVNLSPMQPNFFGVLQQLGIDELTLLSQTQANFNLGFVYHNVTGKSTEPVCNVFGDYAANLAAMSQTPLQLENYNLAAILAANNKFRHPDDNFQSILSSIDYGWMLNDSAYFELLKNKTLSNIEWSNTKITTITQLKQQDEQQLIIDFSASAHAGTAPEQTPNQLCYLTINTEHMPTLLPSAQHQFTTELGLIQLQADQKHLMFKLNCQNQPVAPQAFKSILLSCVLDTLSIDENTKQLLKKQIQIAQVNTVQLATWQQTPLWQSNTIKFASCNAACHFISQLDLLHTQLRQLCTIWPNDFSSSLIASLRRYFNQQICQSSYASVSKFELAHQLFKQQLDNSELQTKLAQYQQAGQVFCPQSEPNQLISEFAWANLFRALNISTEGIQHRFNSIDAKQLNLLKQLEQLVQQSAAQQLAVADYIKRYQIANQ